MLGISHGSKNTIIHLQYQKLCTRCATTFDGRIERTMLVPYFNRLQQYVRKSNKFICRVITGDKWFHHITPTIKRSTLEWLHKTFPHKAKTQCPNLSWKIHGHLCISTMKVLFTPNSYLRDDSNSLLILKNIIKFGKGNHRHDNMTN